MPQPAGQAKPQLSVPAPSFEAVHPGTAVAVVGREAQRLGVAPMQMTEPAADGGFTATASLERDGARVEGKAGRGGSKKTARQAAALSLLAVLTGLAVPADDPPAAPRDFPHDPGLRPADLESWLDYEVARPSPDPELATAVRPGKLTARSVYLLLFEAGHVGYRRPGVAAGRGVQQLDVRAVSGQFQSHCRGAASAAPIPVRHPSRPRSRRHDRAWSGGIRQDLHLASTAASHCLHPGRVWWMPGCARTIGSSRRWQADRRGERS